MFAEGRGGGYGWRMTFEEEVVEEAVRLQVLVMLSTGDAAKIARRIVTERRAWVRYVEALANAADEAFVFAVGKRRVDAAVKLTRDELHGLGVDVDALRATAD